MRAGRTADMGDILSPERALDRTDEALGFIVCLVGPGTARRDTAPSSHLQR